MKLIHELLIELNSIAHDYISDEIDEVELKLQLEWMISRIDKIVINYTVKPLDQLVKKSHTKQFDQMLFKSTYHAKQSLVELKYNTDKRLFQHKLRSVLLNKLYFDDLCVLLNKSCEAYINRNQLKNVPDSIEFFTLKKVT